MVRTGAAVDLQPIDRLEEKVRQLVGMIDTLRAERAKAVDEAARLQRELDARSRAALSRGAAGALGRGRGRCAKNASSSATASVADDHADRQAQSAEALRVVSVRGRPRSYADPRRSRRHSRPALRDPERARPAVHRRARRPTSTRRCARPRANSRSTDPLRIAVIAALNIADELFRARADASGADGRVRARAAEIERLVDAVLDEASRVKVRRTSSSDRTSPRVPCSATQSVCLPALCVMARSVA